MKKPDISNRHEDLLNRDTEQVTLHETTINPFSKWKNAQEFWNDPSIPLVGERPIKLKKNYTKD